jgi:hypothetical protein
MVCKMIRAVAAMAAVTYISMSRVLKTTQVQLVVGVGVWTMRNLSIRIVARGSRLPAHITTCKQTNPCISLSFFTRLVSKCLLYDRSTTKSHLLVIILGN